MDATHQTTAPPELQVVTIGASRWSQFGLKDMWAYRELFFFLTWRDVKVRYKQTLLGVAWAVLQPVFTMIVFTLFFGRFAGIPSDGIPYPLFALAGLLPWTFFSNAVSASSNSLVGNANLITKVYFPRIIIPGAATAAALVDFAVAFVILIVLMIYYGIAISWNLALLPALVLLTTLLALGVGMWTSALNVQYRDIRYALPFMMQIWMFVSPIIYPTSIIPEKYRWALALNPLSGIITGYRASLFGQQFDWSALAVASVATLAFLLYSAYSFRRMENKFADII
ncbi:MAG TPA: ABC transporter permease [Blastocatellia bacterium]|nr:ABC transporter permease [Blastocatellia bacterium]